MARQVVCPSCGTVNRVPAEKPAAKAHCGSCRNLLFQGKPVEVDATGFERQMRMSDVPLLVDVWAPWCGPCRVMGPMFEKAAAQLEPEVRLLKLNADAAPQISERFAIRSIPTMLLLRRDRLVARSSGALDDRRIIAWTRENLPRGT